VPATTLHLPFGTPEVQEVPLSDPPLANVISQVRFPREEALSERRTVDIIRKSVKRYPLSTEARGGVIQIGPNGPAFSEAAETMWRLQDKERVWQVTIAPNFLAIETKRYTSRADFCERLGEIVEAVGAVATPLIFERVGVRYTNRLSVAELDDMADLLQPEVVGLAGMPAHGGGTLIHSVTDLQFGFPDSGHVRARWARLPPNVSIDPNIEAVPEPSFLLDIDAAVDVPDDFTAERVMAAAALCAGRAYGFFRWAVTPEFLARHGAQT
jgi:uncharacterized protein (TIGR04255 family)